MHSRGISGRQYDFKDNGDLGTGLQMCRYPQDATRLSRRHIAFCPHLQLFGCIAEPAAQTLCEQLQL